MASSEVTTVAPGVARTDCFWGYILEGTKDALIAAGLCQSDWFASGRGRDKRGRVVHQKRLVIDGREVHTNGAKGTCAVRVYYTEAEKERREALKQFAKAQVRAEAWLARTPRTHDQYREYAAHTIASSLNIDLDIYMLEGVGGFRFAPEALEEFKEAVHDLLEIVLSGRTLFNRQKHERYILGLKTEAFKESAKYDPGLQGLLQSLETAA